MGIFLASDGLSCGVIPPILRAGPAPESDLRAHRGVRVLARTRGKFGFLPVPWKSPTPTDPDPDRPRPVPRRCTRPDPVPRSLLPAPAFHTESIYETIRSVLADTDVRTSSSLPASPAYACARMSARAYTRECTIRESVPPRVKDSRAQGESP